ncbi:hypothetical protein [Streptomyces caniscabiei]|uniref:hypothetical protein n=1 Tax=Streptomyces caniscabiei TaxID=2746961 RepID=UPI0029A07C65|nr:hypothetical protein [Streptomyces caniscabiei]MDX3733744.1 hypothetical protein [Streptomyces caniscabiei]
MDRRGGFIPYSHTNAQVLTVRKPELDRAEVWFFCELEDYGQPLRHLVNANKDHRSSFALHVGPLEDASQSVGLGLHGWGRDGQTQWMAHDGMFWPGHAREPGRYPAVRQGRVLGRCGGTRQVRQPDVAF